MGDAAKHPLAKQVQSGQPCRSSRQSTARIFAEQLTAQICMAPLCWDAARQHPPFLPFPLVICPILMLFTFSSVFWFVNHFLANWFFFFFLIRNKNWGAKENLDERNWVKLEVSCKTEFVVQNSKVRSQNRTHYWISSHLET